jgi:hypothetical protein
MPHLVQEEPTAAVLSGRRPGPADVDRRAAHPGPLVPHPVTGAAGAATLLALQRRAGNAAVGAVVGRRPGRRCPAAADRSARVVQRCGDVPCDCADEEAHDDRPAPRATAQRQLDDLFDPWSAPDQGSATTSTAGDVGSPLGRVPTSTTTVTGALVPMTSLAPSGGERLCFPPSMFTDPQFGSGFGLIAERLIEQDYCSTLGCDPATTFVDNNNPTQYRNFLVAHNPSLASGAGAVLLAIASATGIARPDLLCDDGARRDWYEIKPLSPAGAAAGVQKLAEITAFMVGLGLPYVPGVTYSPAKDIPIMSGVVLGAPLTVSLNVNRFTPGLVTYSVCLQGGLTEILAKVTIAVLLAWIVTQMLPVLAAAAA